MAFAFRTIVTTRAIKTIENIIKSEDLDVTTRFYQDALGDSIIEIKGDKESIATLRDIFRCVY